MPEKTRYKSIYRCRLQRIQSTGEKRNGRQKEKEGEEESKCRRFEKYENKPALVNLRVKWIC